MSLRLCKYQDQYQILLLCAPRFQRKTKEEEKGFILEEKVLELVGLEEWMPRYSK